MKELLKSELGNHSDPRMKRLALAEFLQHLILQSLYRQNEFQNLVFTGGTALRLLYKINRFSEDLDFSLFKVTNINLPEVIDIIKKDLKNLGFKTEVRLDNERTVFKADFRFSEILHELNLSPLKDQKITIKFEADKNPPIGGEREIMLVSYPITYNVSVFDLSSMFATKLHAVFYRKYTKGRDFYDLMWYLGKEVIPNFKLLNNAIKQSHSSFEKINDKNFKIILANHLEKVDFKKVRVDVERFLIIPSEVNLLTSEHLKSLLRNY